MRSASTPIFAIGPPSRTDRCSLRWGDGPLREALLGCGFYVQNAGDKPPARPGGHVVSAIRLLTPGPILELTPRELLSAEKGVCLAALPDAPTYAGGQAADAREDGLGGTSSGLAAGTGRVVRGRPRAGWLGHYLGMMTTPEP